MLGGGGLNLPFESPPNSITHLSSALAGFDRGNVMVKISGFGEVPVLYCKILQLRLALSGPFHSNFRPCVSI